MEQKVHYLLTALQSSEEGPRRAAEAELFQLYSEDSFPIALINIAATIELDFTGRQAAIVYLRSFIDETWTPPYDKYTGPPIKDEVKNQIRTSLLQLLSDKERKIRAAAAYSVSRIASYDFPEEWPSLLQDLLNAIPTATDEQLHGLLKVLTDLVEDGFSEDQFFPVARQLVEVLHHVAVSENRPTNIRSLAVQAIRSCIELLEMVKDGHPGPVEQFATEVVGGWMSFFIQILKQPFLHLADTNVEEYNGLVTLKLQSYKTISKIVSVFANTMTKYMPELFEVTWSELNGTTERYVKDFVIGDADGRLSNIDGLPFTLDLLMLEEADFLQVCLRAKSVKEKFMQGLQVNQQPLEQLIYTSILLAQITGEDEGLWELDFNVFVAEETAMTANYTARTAAGDLMMRLWDWLQSPVLVSLSRFAAQDQASWKIVEAVFYLLEQAIENGDGGNTFAQLSPDIISGILSNLEKALTHENTNKDDILRFQVDIVMSIGNFLSSQSPEDREEAQDTLSVLASTLKATIRVDPRLALDPSAPIFKLILMLGESGAANIYLSNQLQEIIEDVTEGLPDDFIGLCNQAVPPIVEILDRDSYQEDNSFTNLAADLLNIMLRNAPGSLPSGLVATLVPRLVRFLMVSSETPLLQAGAESLKSIVENDSAQLLQWHDENGKSGLELVLLVIDRLLGPDLSDSAALEIGGLAAEVVEKAAQELGPYLPVLLRGVATRLATAAEPNLIQSLIVVFARLVIKQPSDVVDFLATNSIGDRSGLQVVLSAWLENSSVFSGYAEIKQNVVALANLYALNDPRVAAISVQGDQIVEQTTRIMTRAQRKNNPIRYTSVSAPLKIIKVLVNELGSGSPSNSTWKVDMAGTAKGAIEEPVEEEDGEWEDDDDVIDLGSHAVKQALLGLGEETERSASGLRRGGDDDTTEFIVNFFREASNNNIGGFNEIYGQLTDDEKHSLSKFVG
ncbi:hypothetical protein TWF106_004423 [Orbilia oligospora]|uniref:Importin N-terminal domain-containing protein n=1 Tax=Orbilia oligospora TaxID=2813651 RepID=A0A7C8V3H6_ORBOL|nr:hypothetical protein TWF106_004423 [Orbilia oligospora]